MSGKHEEYAGVSREKLKWAGNRSVNPNSVVRNNESFQETEGVSRSVQETVSVFRREQETEGVSRSVQETVRVFRREQETEGVSRSVQETA